MRKKSLPRVKIDMFRILYYQFLIIVGFVLLFFLCKGTNNALSVLAGALSYWLPTSFFVWVVSAQTSAHAGMRFLAIFVGGEGVKLLLCGMLFIIFIKYLPVQMIEAVIGLAGAIVAFWVASIAFIFKKGVGA